MSERKLTDAQVKEIRESKDTHAALARKYNVRKKLISEIKNGWNYRVAENHVPIGSRRVVKGIDPKEKRKLTPEQVRLVRKELMLGTQIKEIARMVNVSPNAVKNIRDKVTYRDVK